MNRLVDSRKACSPLRASKRRCSKAALLAKKALLTGHVLLTSTILLSSSSAVADEDDGSAEPSEGAPSSPDKSADSGESESPPAEDPHGIMRGAPPRDRSFPDPSLPEGEVRVRVVGPTEEPIQGAEVKLLTLFQSIAQGNSESTKTATSGADGEARFSSLETALRFSYGVAVEREGAVYEIPPFRLDKSGHRVIIHTYPVTADPREALVGLQGFVTIRVKEDLHRVDTVYRVINMSHKTWRPAPIRLQLPGDAQGVEAEISAGDAGFQTSEGGVELVGSFPPGQKDVPFAFFVPNKNEASQSFEMTVPPHVVDMNVLTEFSPGMELHVSPGFPASEERTGRDEKKVLLTRRVMRPGEGQLQHIVMELSGLPVVGPGRWIAVAVALALASMGLLVPFLRPEKQDEDEAEEEERARTTLLNEMLLLKKAFDEGRIGPRTFEQTKREILTALARLEPSPEK